MFKCHQVTGFDRSHVTRFVAYVCTVHTHCPAAHAPCRYRLEALWRMDIGNHLLQPSLSFVCVHRVDFIRYIIIPLDCSSRACCLHHDVPSSVSMLHAPVLHPLAQIYDAIGPRPLSLDRWIIKSLIIRLFHCLSLYIRSYKSCANALFRTGVGRYQRESSASIGWR